MAPEGNSKRKKKKETANAFSRGGEEKGMNDVTHANSGREIYFRQRRKVFKWQAREWESKVSLTIAERGGGRKHQGRQVGGRFSGWKVGVACITGERREAT